MYRTNTKSLSVYLFCLKNNTNSNLYAYTLTQSTHTKKRFSIGKKERKKHKITKIRGILTTSIVYVYVFAH